MKDTTKTRWLPLAAVGFGIAALILRRLLYAAAMDNMGLLTANHPLEIALWAVVLTGAVLLLSAVQKMQGSWEYENNFTASTASFLGHALMGCAILTMVMQGTFPLPGPIAVIWKVLGFAAAPAMLWAGICRKNGQKPFFGIHAATCLFLLLYLVSQYQTWSGNPQLQDYIFDLLAMVALILFSYHCAAFESGMGKRRMQLAAGLMSILLCGVALSGGETPMLYAGGVAWAASDLCRLSLSKEVGVDIHDPS